MQDNASLYHDWQSPLPLEGIPLLPWPDAMFPPPFEAFARELARSTETPIELAAMLTLATVATVSHHLYEVQVKVDYVEPVNLWLLIILPPASRKSRVFNETTSPIRQWEKEQKEKLIPLIQTMTSRQKTKEARLKELRNAAAKAKNESDYQMIQANIEQMEADVIEIPVCPQLWTGDITPEHLGTVMATNNECIALLSDEGGIFDILSGLYSDGRVNIDLFLQSHSGSPVRVERGSRPPIMMQRSITTFGLTVQPEVIRNICKNKTFKGRGLLGRFLYAMPKSNIGSRTLDPPPMTRETIFAYQTAIKCLLAQLTANLDDKINMRHTLSLSCEAYQKWLEYAKTVEGLMGEEIGHLSHITDWAGKLPGAIARIAAVLHIMRYASDQPWLYPISIEEMTAAVKIGHCLINHALAVFDALQLDNAMQTARLIAQWIRDKKLTKFTRRECNRKWRRVKKEEMTSALDILEHHEIIHERELCSVTPGRKSNIFDVNPLFIKE